MQLNEGHERHHEENVFLAMRMPNAHPMPAFQHNGAGGVHSRATRRRVHPVHQRLLCAYKPLLGGSAISRLAGLWHVGLNLYLNSAPLMQPQSAMPPPSTTSAAPVMNEESAEARNN